MPRSIARLSGLAELYSAGPIRSTLTSIRFLRLERCPTIASRPLTAVTTATLMKRRPAFRPSCVLFMPSRVRKTIKMPNKTGTGSEPVLANSVGKGRCEVPAPVFLGIA